MEYIGFLNKAIGHGVMLDIGCGAGRHAIAAAQAGYEVRGIDFSEPAIEIATAQAQASGVAKKVGFCCGSCLDLPYDDTRFDAANDDGCLHHIHPDNWELYLENVTRVLKPAGFLRVRAYSRHNEYYTNHLVEDDASPWIFDEDSGYTYFFRETELVDLFAKHFEVLAIKDNQHHTIPERSLFSLLLRKPDP